MKVTELLHAGGRCPIYIGQGLLGMDSIWLRHLDGRVLVVSDETVAELYLTRITDALGTTKSWRSLVLPAGETHKTVANWQRVMDELVAMRAQRDATVIALGGGMIGDLAGFAAASYMRGIRVVQMPTTLLAQVDAAIGGKTGVNHASGKNLIGAFHQPAAVVADIDTLGSLDERDYLAGLAEVIKYGAIRDEHFFSWLESRSAALKARMPDALLEAVHASAAYKCKIVSADERESGQRALLNFGHTFGHALETVTDYQRYRHGEAVAVGMVIAARLSELLGRLRVGNSERLVHLLKGLGLPVHLPDDIDRERMLSLMRLDKKNRADHLRLILLDAIGEASITTCPSDDIREVLKRS